MDLDSKSVCPKCGYPSSRSDLCESCGALINRIRTRQGVAAAAKRGQAHAALDDVTPRFSAFSYESPVSAASFARAILIVALIAAGYLGFQYYQGRSAHAGAPSANVRVLDQNAFSALVTNTKSADTWVVQYHASWSSPCAEFAPEFNAVAGKHADRAKFASVDVDAVPAAARHFNVHSVPTVLMVRSGNVIATAGAMSQQDFEHWLNTLL